MKHLQAFLILLSATFFTVPLASAQTANTLPKLEKVEIIEVKVKGVGCSADIKSISENVENLEGVSNCKVLKKGATTKFEVYLLPSKVSKERIYATIEDTPGCKNPNDRPYKVKDH
ncbi:heavy-metal-associated domain-containing protein [Portibacter marinus]|uniref:heavy-metal-associated domain-containing protein n=1 Tax=Portibacter marinus TaxID=2898660 RepID=UPI001F45300F|nr:heavy metal-associated domain-containing protein [Portibacter marinus]